MPASSRMSSALATIGSVGEARIGDEERPGDAAARQRLRQLGDAARRRSGSRSDRTSWRAAKSTGMRARPCVDSRCSAGLRGGLDGRVPVGLDVAAELERRVDLAKRLQAGAGAAHGDVAVVEEPAEERLVDVDALDLLDAHLDRVAADEAALEDDPPVGDRDLRGPALEPRASMNRPSAKTMTPTPRGPRHGRIQVRSSMKTTTAARMSRRPARTSSTRARSRRRRSRRAAEPSDSSSWRQPVFDRRWKLFGRVKRLVADLRQRARRGRCP